MAQFARALGLSGRMVIDQRGITEKFDFQVEYAPDGAGLSDELTAPPIDSVPGKLGLRLERAKGPREFLVIDHVEKRPKTDTATCSPKSGQIAWVSFGKQTRVTFPKRRRSQFEIRPTWAPSLDETSVFALTRFYTKELSWFEHWGFMPQGF